MTTEPKSNPFDSAEYYSHREDETSLSYTDWSEALDDFLGNESYEHGVTIYGFTRAEVEPTELQLFANEAAERALELYDEEFGDPDESMSYPSRELAAYHKREQTKLAERLKPVLAEYFKGRVPWLFKQTGEREFSRDECVEFLRENAPELLKDEE